MRRRGIQDFHGAVAVVTGAGSGIGRATARLLAREGATVHVADLDGESAATVRDEITAAGGDATAHTVDVTDAAAVEALAEHVYAAAPAVHVLHNNAGIGAGGPVEEMELNDWRRLVEVNLMGVVHGVHAFVPRMLGQGADAHIVNTASLAGLVAVPDLVGYATTKHAVVGLSESLNAELGPRGIHCTALCPGVINTPIIARSTMRGDMEQRQARVVRFYERFGASPEVVAEAAVGAIRRRQVVRTVPRSHAALGWGLRRLSPRAGQLPARLLARLSRRV